MQSTPLTPDQPTTTFAKVNFGWTKHYDPLAKMNWCELPSRDTGDTHRIPTPTPRAGRGAAVSGKRRAGRTCFNAWLQRVIAHLEAHAIVCSGRLTNRVTWVADSEDQDLERDIRRRHAQLGRCAGHEDWRDSYVAAVEAADGSVAVD